MTQQTPATPPKPRSRNAASENDQRGAVLLGVLVALAALATALMLLSENQVAMKLAIVTALWAAILGMFLVHSGRRRLQAQQEQAAAVQRGLEEQLAQAERHHLQQQELLSRQVQEAAAQDDTLKAIRDQLAEVRAQLEALSGIEFVEPTAIRAQARRVGELSNGTTPTQPEPEEPPALAEADPIEPTEPVIPATPVTPAAPAVTPATPVAPANPAAPAESTSATVTSVASVTETATVAVVETSAEDDTDSKRGSHRAGSVTVEELKAAREQQARERAEALALRRANAEAVRQRRLAEEKAAAHARETSAGGVKMLDEILPQLGGGGAAEETYRRNAIKDTIGERMDTGTFARQRWAEPEPAEPQSSTESSTGASTGGRRRAAEQETGGRRRKDEHSESLSVADLLKKGKQQ